jgi:hypothetical protein
MSDRIAAGFLTTFTMLARDRLSIEAMAHLLVKVFFGYVGETIPIVTALSDHHRSSVLGLVGSCFMANLGCCALTVAELI